MDTIGNAAQANAFAGLIDTTPRPFNGGTGIVAGRIWRPACSRTTDLKGQDRLSMWWETALKVMPAALQL